MNITWKRLSLVMLFLAALPLIAQTTKSNAVQSAPAHKQTGNASEQTAKERDGQQVWEQNCSRCHNAPEGFSSHISGTIIRHMRIRAGLSKQDEQALMRFLNP